MCIYKHFSKKIFSSTSGANLFLQRNGLAQVVQNDFHEEMDLHK